MGVENYIKNEIHVIILKYHVGQECCKKSTSEKLFYFFYTSIFHIPPGCDYFFGLTKDRTPLPKD